MELVICTPYEVNIHSLEKKTWRQPPGARQQPDQSTEQVIHSLLNSKKRHLCWSLFRPVKGSRVLWVDHGTEMSPSPNQDALSAQTFEHPSPFSFTTASGEMRVLTKTRNTATAATTVPSVHVFCRPSNHFLFTSLPRLLFTCSL